VHNEPRPADIAAKDIPKAVAALEGRIEELRNARIPQDDSSLTAISEQLANKIEATLLRFFGPDTAEFRRARLQASIFWPVAVTGNEGPEFFSELFMHGRKVAISRLQSEVDLLRERLDDDESDRPDPIKAYENPQLQPEIERAAGALFRDGHHANAVQDAVKALNGLVRLRSGLELDGEDLMRQAFSPKAPKLVFNAMADQSDKDEQRGFMDLFAGAVSGLRNPHAHKFIHDDPERALEFIAFVSLLAKLLDNAKRVPPN
jgi:uncharacterized protein (TIGR02391 family)